MNNQYVIGDIHGEYDKLKKLIDKINPTKGDLIVFLGDYVDRGPDSYNVIRFLLELDNEISCKFLIGNHDAEWYNSLMYNDAANTLDFTLWLQGSKETFDSYQKAGVNPEDHLPFFRMLDYHFTMEDDLKRFFVHGGFNRHKLISEHTNDDVDIFMWDRDFIGSAMSHHSSVKEIRDKHAFKTKDKFDRVYLGHTPTKHWGKTEPMFISNLIWLMDTGVGKWKDSELYALDIINEHLIK